MTMTQLSEITMTQAQIRNALTSYLTEHVLKNAAVVKDVIYNPNGSLTNTFTIKLEAVQTTEEKDNEHVLLRDRPGDTA